MRNAPSFIAREVTGFSTVARQTIFRTRNTVLDMQFTVTHWRAPEMVEVVAHDAGEPVPWQYKKFTDRAAALGWIEKQLAF